MKQAGLIIAEAIIEHGDFIKTFALLSDFEVRGNRAMICLNALVHYRLTRYQRHREDWLT